jgi:hypothetical protein
LKLGLKSPEKFEVWKKKSGNESETMLVSSALIFFIETLNKVLLQKPHTNLMSILRVFTPGNAQNCIENNFLRTKNEVKSQYFQTGDLQSFFYETF